MFELEAFYGARSLCDKFTYAVYREFGTRDTSSRYAGVTISLFATIDLAWFGRVRDGWQKSGVLRRPVDQAAAELVDLIEERIPHRKSIPATLQGLGLEVDAPARPALAAMTSYVSCSRCPEDDPRRSDGRASPLVIAASATNLKEEDMVAAIGAKMEEKVTRKREGGGGWNLVDRAILVPHDLPRWHIYQGFGMKWQEWVTQAAEQTNALSEFDEIWLVTYQQLEGEALPIHRPSSSS